MFELSVETTFAAAHAIVINGVREPVHGHNWHVTALIAGPELDAEGLLLDFHAAERCLAEITAPFRNADLNAVEPFTRLNPTAENVALHIAHALAARLPDTRPAPGAHVRSVRVTEAPGCAATYYPSPPSPPSPSPSPASVHPAAAS